MSQLNWNMRDWVCQMTVMQVLCPLGTLQVSLLNHLCLVCFRAACVFGFTPSVILISLQSIAFNCPFDRVLGEKANCIGSGRTSSDGRSNSVGLFSCHFWPSSTV